MKEKGEQDVRLIPSPRGTGLFAAPVPKKLLVLAGIEDCYTSARGHTRTMGNSVKATFYALRAMYTYLTPDLWEQHVFGPSPYQEHKDVLEKTAIKK
ncbi:hypothetical protein PsorP6_014298 [Peronosclerospora sorghi]|uniref:Uncharacterized protein n=1 Tax=Peronosclerospora sorghi TaxID=230839 RepID=A0ACC0VJA0_9STRA|nr:hypothetical protein PsorP6_014298 [Peronosclerospora sorghi]